MARPRKQRIMESLPLLSLIEDQKRCAARQRGFREALSRDLDALLVAREVVAEEMTRLLGVRVTKSTLDCWTSREKEHRMPAEYLPAWVRVTGRTGALRAIAEACGCVLVVPDEVRRELERVVVERRSLEARERLLRELMEVCL